MITLAELSHTLRQRLLPVCHSAQQAAAEAALILESQLGATVETVYAEPDRPVSGQDCERVTALLERRVAERMPIQYLLGEAVFYGLRFKVSPAVLIPRPETELLVDAAAEICQAHGGRSILDIGTGSGAIPLALAHRLGDAVTLAAIDLSEAALAVARENAARLNLTDRVRFLHGDLLAPVAGERFDLILSNPPYIHPGEKQSLTAEVLAHEPHQALFVPPGEAAVYFYRRIAEAAPACLTPGGWVIVEMGQGMAEAVSACFSQAGFREIRVMPDYAGIDRVLIARFGAPQAETVRA
jgi:release factor glutamine methyltransferase